MNTVQYQGKEFVEIPKGKRFYFVNKETTEVLSLMRPKFPKILKQVKNHKGYYMIGFFTKPNHICEEVHRIMMCTFVPNPDKLPMINHIDGNKLNNQLSNLEWCTAKHNTQHAIRTKLWTPDYCVKEVHQYALNGCYLKSYKSLHEAASAVNSNPANLCIAVKSKSQFAKGFLWSYQKKDILQPIKQATLGFRITSNTKTFPKVTDKEAIKILGISRTCFYDRFKKRGTTWFLNEYTITRLQSSAFSE